MEKTYNCFKGKEISVIDEEGNIRCGEFAKENIENENVVSIGYEDNGMDIKNVGVDRDRFMHGRHLAICGSNNRTILAMNILRQLDNTRIYISQEEKEDVDYDIRIKSLLDLDVSKVVKSVDKEKFSRDFSDSVLRRNDEAQGATFSKWSGENLKSLFEAGYNDIRNIGEALSTTSKEDVLEKFDVENWEYEEDSYNEPIATKWKTAINEETGDSLVENIEEGKMNRILVEKDDLVTPVITLLRFLLNNPEKKQSIVLDDVDDPLLENRLSTFRSYNIELICTSPSLMEDEHKEAKLANISSFIFLPSNHPGEVNVVSNVLRNLDREDYESLKENELIHSLYLKGGEKYEGVASMYPLYEK